MKYKEKRKRKNEEKIKTMVKVSHELPINLLHKSFDWNDYEYCLPHLLDFEVNYLDHFLKAKKDKRYIIMDNSLHE